MFPATAHLAVLRRQEVLNGLDIVREYGVHGRFGDEFDCGHDLLVKHQTIGRELDQESVRGGGLVALTVKVVREASLACGALIYTDSLEAVFGSGLVSEVTLRDISRHRWRLNLRGRSGRGGRLGFGLLLRRARFLLDKLIHECVVARLLLGRLLDHYWRLGSLRLLLGWLRRLGLPHRLARLLEAVLIVRLLFNGVLGESLRGSL